MVKDDSFLTYQMLGYDIMLTEDFNVSIFNSLCKRAPLTLPLHGFKSVGCTAGG